MLLINLPSFCLHKDLLRSLNDTALEAAGSRPSCDGENMIQPANFSKCLSRMVLLLIFQKIVSHRTGSSARKIWARDLE